MKEKPGVGENELKKLDLEKDLMSEEEARHKKNEPKAKAQ